MADPIQLFADISPKVLDLYFFFLIIGHPPRSTLFPYTPLFRSQAGASMKGEFENRLRQVIDEVQASPKPIILFIDEAHTLIGAGGPAGTGDAANLLKPALARGDRKSTRLNSRHLVISYAGFFLK